MLIRVTNSVNVPNIFHKQGWDDDWHQDWDRKWGNWNRNATGMTILKTTNHNNYPKPCSDDVTNTVKVKATAGSVTVTAQDTETVKVTN